MSFASGVLGTLVAKGRKFSDPDEEAVGGRLGDDVPCVKVGDNCDTYASASSEKKNPCCCRVVTTVRRDRLGTSM